VRAEAARTAIGLDLLKVHEAHQVQRGGGVTGGEGAWHDLERTCRADGIEKGGGFSLSRGGTPRERHYRRMERNSIRHQQHPALRGPNHAAAGADCLAVLVSPVLTALVAGCAVSGNGAAGLPHPSFGQRRPVRCM
jgi:hypothetical protein